MMNKRLPYIYLDGIGYSLPEIELQIEKKLGSLHLPSWELELYLFLKEWISPDQFIKVQTSGSTGDPKNMTLSKSFLVKSAERTIGYFQLQTNQKVLLSLPCRYIAGKMMVVRAIVGQLNLIAVDPSTDFKFLENRLYDFGAMVPNQVFKLLASPFGREKIEHVRNLLIGGSNLPSVIEEKIKTFNNRIVSTYGMTETASHIAVREISGEKRSAFYQCLDGISVSVNNAGCLQICIHEIPELLITKDLAEIISPKEFKIIGRSDNVIISGGIKFSPETIEKKLESLINRPFIISSLPDEKLGQKLVLIVEGKKFRTAELEENMRKKLSAYEFPKEIIFVKKLQLTSSGKVKRKLDLK
jgi:O-succinylbenzoic acid--CoA ligase